MSDLWLPPGSRRFAPDVEAAIEKSRDPERARHLAEVLQEQGVDMTSADALGARLGPNKAMICPPREWGTIPVDDGARTVLSALIDCEPLQQMILNGVVSFEGASVVTTAELPFMQALCPLLFLQLKEFQIVTPLAFPECPAPANWLELVKPGFALAVDDPDPDDDRILYVATPEMHAAPPGFVLDPDSRPAKVGRNERCPCGSGVKFKHCCGR